MNRWRICGALIATALSAGCAIGGGERGEPARVACETPQERAAAAGLGAERFELSQGYSMLYTDAGKLGWAELLLAVKVESDGFDRLIRKVSGFGRDLKQDLERLARDYPGVRVDLDPLPDIEKRKRRALTVDRARYFAPWVGEGKQREYERTMLISLANGINHERSLCKVMAEMETEPALKRFLERTRAGYDALYDDAIALLDREYFKDPEPGSRP